MENCRYIIRVHEMTAARIRSIEEVLNNMVRYDGQMTHGFQTHVGLLDRLEVLMGNQTECRTGSSLGIAVIVGILLTALDIQSVEFRQNEYVYTLMKSFGGAPCTADYGVYRGKRVSDWRFLFGSRLGRS